MGSKALIVNCWRFKSNSIFRDYKRFLLKELNGVTRVTYHGRNVLVGTRNKFRLTSKKNSSLLATVIRPNKQKTLTHQLVITELDEQKINESSKQQNEHRNNKVSTIVRKEDIATIPNLLCVTRIALSPVLGYLVLQHNYSCALGIFVFAGVTDLLDGMIARQFPSQRSMLGSFLDPMADKLLVSTLFLSLTAADLIPVPLTALIISRDVCLMCAGFYIRYVSLPSPKTLSRYFDMTLATANLSPTIMSKVNTSVQLSLVATTLAASVAGMTDHAGLHGLWYVTAATTIASAMSYVFVKDTFKLLRHPHLNRKRLSARRFLPTRSAASTRHTIAQQEI